MAGRNSIYEVFRACRMCGGGGGYKMPIVNLEDELDMRHKIRECVRIEVHQDDKMPPLICELCVDKVNDYYEFLEMCRATDSRTRQRLGLQQSAPSGANDPSDCILGVTGPVFVNEDSGDAEPLVRQKNRLIVGGKSKKGQPAVAAKKSSSPLPVLSIRRSGAADVKTGIKELKVSLNGLEGMGSHLGVRNSRAVYRPPTPPRGGRRPPTPPRGNRRAASPPRSRRRAPSPPRAPSPVSRRSQRDGSRDSSKKVKTEVKKPLPPSKPPPRGVMKRDIREGEQSRTAKRVKMALKPLRARAEKRRASPPARPEPKKAAREQPALPCALCDSTYSRPHLLQQHMKAAHSPTFTLDRLACNACGEWFASADEAATHHRWHKASAPYVCRLCTAEFRQLLSYNKHFVSKQCVPSTEVPDVQCSACWAYYPTTPLLDAHRCRGEDARPGGNCAKCKRKFATYKTLRRHEDACCRPGPKRRGVVNVSPELLKRVLPLQIRVARCDPLLQSVKQEHYDVSHVDREFGLDKTCVYPYIASVRSIKREPGEYGDIKHEMDFEESSVQYEYYTDSDSEPEMTEIQEQGAPRLVANPFAKKKKSVDALSTLSIKAIFSKKCLGPRKIQRKKKKRPLVKPEVKQEPGDVDCENTRVNEVFREEERGENDNEGRIDITEQPYMFGDDDNDDDDVRRTIDDLIAGVGTIDSIMFDKTTASVNSKKVYSEETSIGNNKTENNIEDKMPDSDKEITALDMKTIKKDLSLSDKSKEFSLDKLHLTTSDYKPNSDSNEIASPLTQTEYSKCKGEKLNIDSTEIASEPMKTNNESTGEKSNSDSIEIASQLKQTGHDEFKDKNFNRDSIEIATEPMQTKYSESAGDKLNSDSIEIASNPMLTEHSESIFSNLNKVFTSIDINGDIIQTNKNKETSRREDEKSVSETEFTNYDEDFDVNAAFSGELGANALKIHGKLKADDKLDTLENIFHIKDALTSITPDVDVRLCDTNVKIDTNPGSIDVETEKNCVEIEQSHLRQCETNEENAINDIENATDKFLGPTAVESAVVSNSVSVIVSCNPISHDKNKSTETVESKSTENMSQSESSENEPKLIDNTEEFRKTDLQQTRDSESDPLHNVTKLDQTKIVSKSEQIEMQPNSTLRKRSEDELLNELDDISDTEFDDNELMNEIDAQIRGTKLEEKERTGDKSETAECEAAGGKTDSDDKISLDDLLISSADTDRAKPDDKFPESMHAEFNFD